MRPTRRLLTAVLPVVLAVGPVIVASSMPATAADRSDGWEGRYPRLVDFAFVQQYATLPPRPGVTLIDARPTAYRYDPGHIPGAVSIPDYLFEDLTDRLPKDRNELLIVYCEGEPCMLSHFVAFKAERLGYRNIRVYAGGFPEWVAMGGFPAVSAAHVRRLIEEQDRYLLVDVRPADAFAQGAIPTAVNLPEGRLDPERLPADKDLPLIFHGEGPACTPCVQAAEGARGLGYGNVSLYPGGYAQWQHGQAVAR